VFCRRRVVNSGKAIQVEPVGHLVHVLHADGPTRLVGAAQHTATGGRQLNSLILREALLIDIESATPRQTVEDDVSMLRPERRGRGLIRRVEGQ